jgi:hypothetical protein
MKYKIVIGLLLSAVCYSGAATVNIGGVISGATGLVASVEGTPLSGGGYYIGVGSFDTVPVIPAGTKDISSFVTTMNLFASNLSPTAVGNTQGTIVGAFAGIGGANPSKFNNKQIYVVVGNAATALASTHWAIMTTTTNILFPADVTTSSTATISFGSIANSVMVPNAGTEIDNTSPVKDRIALVGVPEPSAALLGALGALGLLRRRRI